MLDLHEAHKLLVHAGFKTDMQSSYPIPVVLDAKHEDVRKVLREHGYEGDFVVIREINSSKHK